MNGFRYCCLRLRIFPLPWVTSLARPPDAAVRAKGFAYAAPGFYANTRSNGIAPECFSVLNCTPKVGHHPTFGVFCMTKYNESLKLAIVQEYLSSSLGYTALGNKHSVDRAAIRRWVSGYEQHGLVALRKKSSQYSAEFKRTVLERIRQESLSYRQVIALFDLRVSTAVVSSWVRQYHEQGLAGLQPKPRGRSKKMTNPESPRPAPAPPTDTRTLDDLRKENDYLRAEVAYLKKLRALLQAKEQAAQKKRK